MTDQIKVFISAATGDFGDYRQELAETLKNAKMPNISHVDYQEEFTGEGVHIVQKLCNKILAADVVIHLLGPNSGAHVREAKNPSEDMWNWFQQNHAGFMEWFNFEENERPSYTQLEFLFGCFQKKICLAYMQTGTKFIDESQMGHFDRVKNVTDPVSSDDLASLTQSICDSLRSITQPYKPPPFVDLSVSKSIGNDFSVRALHMKNQWLDYQEPEAYAKVQQFIESDETFSWWGVIANGGMGKSRLALQLVQSLDPTRWEAGSIEGGEARDTWLRGLDIWRPVKHTLIVVDYASSNSAALYDGLMKLARNASRDNNLLRRKVRVLILDRPGAAMPLSEQRRQPSEHEEPRVEKIREFLFQPRRTDPGLKADFNSANQPHTELTPALFQMIDFLPLSHTREEQAEIIRRVFEKLKTNIPVPNADDEIWWQKIERLSGGGRPLLLQAIAAQFVLDGNTALDHIGMDAVIDNLLKREEKTRWPLHGTFTPQQIELIKKTLAFSTLMRGLKADQKARVYSYLGVTEHPQLAETIASILGAEDQRDLPPYEPDLLGERLLLNLSSWVDSHEGRSRPVDPENWITKAAQLNTEYLDIFFLLAQDFAHHPAFTQWLRALLGHICSTRTRWLTAHIPKIGALYSELHRSRINMQAYESKFKEIFSTGSEAMSFAIKGALADSSNPQYLVVFRGLQKIASNYSEDYVVQQKLANALVSWFANDDSVKTESQLDEVLHSLKVLARANQGNGNIQTKLAEGLSYYIYLIGVRNGNVGKATDAMDDLLEHVAANKTVETIIQYGFGIRNIALVMAANQDWERLEAAVSELYRVSDAMDHRQEQLKTTHWQTLFEAILGCCDHQQWSLSEVFLKNLEAQADNSRENQYVHLRLMQAFAYAIHASWAFNKPSLAARLTPKLESIARRWPNDQQIQLVFAIYKAHKYIDRPLLRITSVFNAINVEELNDELIWLSTGLFVAIKKLGVEGAWTLLEDAIQIFSEFANGHRNLIEVQENLSLALHCTATPSANIIEWTIHDKAMLDHQNLALAFPKASEIQIGLAASFRNAATACSDPVNWPRLERYLLDLETLSQHLGGLVAVQSEMAIAYFNTITIYGEAGHLGKVKRLVHQVGLIAAHYPSHAEIQRAFAMSLGNATSYYWENNDFQLMEETNRQLDALSKKYPNSQEIQIRVAEGLGYLISTQITLDQPELLNPSLQRLVQIARSYPAQERIQLQLARSATAALEFYLESGEDSEVELWREEIKSTSLRFPENETIQRLAKNAN